VECYYEGGIARVHLFGAIAEDQPPAEANLLEGAVISHVSNEHYGRPEQAVAGNRKEMHMVGWESARTGFGEQALFHLKQPAVIREMVVDTYLHRLNAPLSCHVFGINEPDAGKIEAHMRQAPRWKLVFSGGREVIPENFQEYMLAQRYLQERGGNTRKFRVSLHRPDGPWQALLPFVPLSPDTFHRFPVENCGAVTHLLYMHYPNGGIHGLKAFGSAA
jgi:allantoicase